MFVSMFVCAAAVALGADQTTVPLHSGEITVTTLSGEDRKAQLAACAAHGGDNHVLVVLADAYIDKVNLLAQQGIDLQASLGGNAWIAAVSPHAAGSTLAVEAIEWVGPLDPAWKLHPFLADGGVPEWTIDRTAQDALLEGRPFNVERLLNELDTLRDPRVVLYILAHKDINLDALADDLPVLADAKVISQLETVHGLVAAVPTSAIVPLSEDARVLWVEPALPPLSEKNDQNREVTGSNIVQSAPYGLDGDGVVVMVYDGGYAFAGHQDFGGRLTVRDSAGTSDHATHVSGTIGGDGSASGGQYAGMAPAVTIESYGFEQEGGLEEGFLYTDPGDLEQDYGQAINDYGAVIANNSIGTNTAPNGFPCEWTGDYGITSSVIDAVVRGSLGGDIRIVWANGNERQTDRCGQLYHTTAPPACAKNHITVGALNSNDESVTSFTSWGPADDGRIKPDISTAGCQSDGDGGVTSCSSSGGYSSKCGTSMASPTACGIGALLIQDWRQQYPLEDDMRNSTLKALLAHTAADLGNVGPDCQYGYGSIRAQDAVDHLRGGSFVEAEVSSGESYEFLVIVPANADTMQVTVAWDDEPAIPLVIPSLVNDLDLIVLAPDGTRRYPWAIDPADPGAPATQNAEDHLNNIEQVTVQSPQAGVWRVQVHGFAVPVGPQAFSVMATPDLVACSRTGIVGLDRVAYPLEGDLAVTVVDCDLNSDDSVVDTVDVLIRSDDEPAGEWITLVEEDPAASTFSATMPTSTTDAPGTLHATHGSTIEAIYTDAEDADGNTDVQVTASAVCDGEAPTLIQHDATAKGPRTIRFDVEASELTGLIIRWGTSCDNLVGSVGPGGADYDHSILVGGFEDNTTYYYTIELIDQAGNTATFDNDGACWSVTTPDIPDFFTEQFGTGFDLDGLSIVFDPAPSIDGYTACPSEITAFPVDPAGGTSVSLSDDDYETINPALDVVLYEQAYSQVHIGSNGVLTFLSGDSDYTESLSEHFNLPRISVLWDDLNPSLSGTVSWKNTGSGVAITWQNVPEYSSSNSNSFQAVMNADGSIVLSWLGIDSDDSIVGLSEGVGMDPDYYPSDLSEIESGCGPIPPTSEHQDLTMLPGDTLDIMLEGWDDGLPDPPGLLTFVIETLPVHPLRDLETGGLITATPYAFTAGAVPTVRYEPPYPWQGTDSFTFFTDDGGSPPEGGASPSATVTIDVANAPQVIHAFPMDTDPGWSTEGLWDFGTPTGGGGQNGNPDPTSGATGAFVFGYNLNGDYENYLPERALTTQAFDFSGMTNVELRFKRWLNVQNGLYDHAYIRVSNGPFGWTTVWENGNEITDASWSSQVIDLSDVADGQQGVRIEWVMGTTDSTSRYSGWNIDDVEIWAVLPIDTVPGDANGDGVVNADDILLVISQWGPCDPGEPCGGDVNGDGVVNTNDILMVIANWSGAGTPRSGGGEPIEWPSEIEQDNASTTIEEIVLINADRMAPAQFDGLIRTAGDYVQRPWAVLEMEVAGALPLTDHDLLLVEGTAHLDGTLFVHVTNTPPGRYTLITAGSIDGRFSDIVVADHAESDAHVCVTDRTVTLIVPPVDESDAGTPEVQNVRDVIDALGTSQRRWDTDDDGIVTEADLAWWLIDGLCR